MAEKPKLFIINACRGTKKHPAVDVTMVTLPNVSSVKIFHQFLFQRHQLEIDSSADMILPPSRKNYPLIVDYHIVFSTLLGMESYRKPQHGTVFIQSMCSNLQQLAGSLDYVSIMERVRREMAHKRFPDDEGEVVQLSEDTSTLVKKVFFKKKS